MKPILRCPRCGAIMIKHIYHHEDEITIKYICPRCGYTEYHHYPIKYKYPNISDVKLMYQRWIRKKVI